MRLVRQQHLKRGSLFDSPVHEQIEKDIKDAVEAIKWPANAETFTINPTKKGNGVKPIKEAFTLMLESRGWTTEERLALVRETNNPGPIDAVKVLPDDSLFLVEWETGNISSSHRALNKILAACYHANKGDTPYRIAGGALILPMKDLAQYLTDRVGNFEELSAYFDYLGNATQVGDATLTIYGVAEDATDPSVRLIKKGTDGRALI